ncbi:hypothetical protein BD289DRAFT_221754 [Coniella lustricola]|uniref:Uncharacterized protein n=1 Tax=Coniella lustricola TaxID=2025994 RepID=A0A2T3AB59_9PEZI|nr:hypothetical protein BD289DRAFT_221754 [Coniella lustricola]
MKYSAFAIALFGTSVVSALEPVVVESTAAAASSNILSFTLVASSTSTLAPASQKTGGAKPPHNKSHEGTATTTSEHFSMFTEPLYHGIMPLLQGREEGHQGQGKGEDKKEAAEMHGKHSKQGGQGGGHGGAKATGIHAQNDAAHFVGGGAAGGAAGKAGGQRPQAMSAVGEPVAQDAPEVTGAAGLQNRSPGLFDRSMGLQFGDAVATGAAQHFVTGGAMRVGDAHHARPTVEAGDDKEAGGHAPSFTNDFGGTTIGIDTPTLGQTLNRKRDEHEKSKHGGKKSGKHGSKREQLHFPIVRIGMSRPTNASFASIANGTNSTSLGGNHTNNNDNKQSKKPLYDLWNSIRVGVPVDSDTDKNRFTDDILPRDAVAQASSVIEEPTVPAGADEETSPKQSGQAKPSVKNGAKDSEMHSNAQLTSGGGRFHGIKGKKIGGGPKQNSPMAMAGVAAGSEQGAPQASNVPQVTAKPRVRRGAIGAHPDARLTKTAHERLTMTTLVRVPLRA